MTMTCRECGASFNPGLSEEKMKAFEDGYSITVRCPNPKCENHHGGLVAKPNKEV